MCGAGLIAAAASRVELLRPKKFAFPAKAGIHLSGDGAVERWIPAFAGNADLQLVAPLLNPPEFSVLYLAVVPV